MKTLVLVDGSSFLYRAFHALPPLTNSKGAPTGAILGVCNMLRRLIERYPEAYLAVIFDAPGRTFRDDLFEQYKANRPSMPDDLRLQIAPLHKVIEALGIPLIVHDGVEADDVIGTLSTEASRQNFKVIISTGDKDMAQLVSPNVTLENSMYDQKMDREGVITKFGVPPERIIDYLALVGDTSDNIPGVPKVGPKTAAKWLNEFGSLDQIVERAAEIPGKVGESLRASLPQIPLSRQLATICCEVPLHISPDNLQRKAPDQPTLESLLRELGFTAWLKSISPSPPSEPAIDRPAQHNQGHDKTPRHYETIATQSQLELWLGRLEASKSFSFDTETDGLDYMRAQIVGISFSVVENEAAYLPLAHRNLTDGTQLDRNTTLGQLKAMLEDASYQKIGQNLKFDQHILANHGIQLRGIQHDTMLESYVFQSASTRHDMDSLAQHYLGLTTISYEDVTGKGAKQICFSEVDIDTATNYAAEDADITLKLHHHLWPKLEQTPALAKVYQSIELPLIPVLVAIERNGVLVDIFMLAEQSRELELRMQQVEQEAHQAAGQTFNLGSPKQIQSILYEKLGLPVIKKTPTGQPSTDESVLAELAHSFELPKLILDFRSLSKLRSTYTEKLPRLINPETGRVHTSYHQAVTATGRLSSSDPNLQNIPVRTAEGRRIRQAFIAPEGHLIVAADYSQIELRIMAHFSKDASLLKAFGANQDVHAHTASEIFGVPPEQVTSDQRRSAKAINFGLIYGMSAFGLAKQLDLDRGTAQTYIDLYFERYPAVKTFMDATRESARENGFVETLMGRRLYVPEIRSKNAQIRQYAERTAINAPMQGTAADIIKLAMIDIHDWIESSSIPARMIMQVHDELVFEVNAHECDTFMAGVRERMSQVVQLEVPLIVDIRSGKNWDEAH
jgi:DNA polymerase-1